MSQLAVAALSAAPVCVIYDAIRCESPGGGSGAGYLSSQKRSTRLLAGAGCEIQSEVATGGRDARSKELMGWNKSRFRMAPT